MIKHLPNFLTCCNLICGCLGLIFLWEDSHVETAYFVWAACMFDFFDGFAARLLKVSSPIGKELGLDGRHGKLWRSSLVIYV